MTIDFNFLKSVLREYSADEQSGINAMIIEECRIDGVEVNQSYTDLAHTYKSIYRLALGDSLSEKVGNVSRSRTGAVELSNQYEKMYKELLSKNNIALTDDMSRSELPSIVV